MYIDTKIPKGLFPARNIKVQRYGMVVFVLCIPPADFAKRTTYPPTTIKNDSKNHDEPIFGPTGCEWGFLGLLLDGGRKKLLLWNRTFASTSRIPPFSSFCKTYQHPTRLGCRSPSPLRKDGWYGPGGATTRPRPRARRRQWLDGDGPGGTRPFRKQTFQSNHSSFLDGGQSGGLCCCCCCCCCQRRGGKLSLCQGPFPCR